MGITLPVPLAPFEELDVQGDSITIEVDAKQIVIPTDNQYLLPSFNQWTENPNRCTLEETPCGGLKNSIVQDKFPGALSIEGDGCYLQNIDGTYTGKSIGAGKLSESSSIKDTGIIGLEIATADGAILRMGDGLPFLLRPPSAIVEEFVIRNISNKLQTYTLSIVCPDSFLSIEIYNIMKGIKESVTLTKIVSGYTFSKTIDQNYSESFQITIIYNSLDFPQSFTNDANTTIGLENMAESWIAWLPNTGSDIDFIHFLERPKQLSYTQKADGTISQITIYPGNGSLYHGRIIHSNHGRVTGSGYVPDCLNKNVTGSITKFLQAHGMQTNFPSDATITTWVVPAISDEKILPMSTISDDFLGAEISLRMCPGEYGCASFVVKSDKDIILEIEVSDLVSDDGILLKENIDMRVIKCWYQGGNSIQNYNRYGRYLTPELLLHDDLIVISSDDFLLPTRSNMGGKNHLRLTTGDYIDTSTGVQKPTPTLICDDASFLKPVHMYQNYNKQIWITPHISDDTIPGNYIGTMYLKNGGAILKTITLNITVLPFSLPIPMIEHSVYYRPKLTTQTGAISSLKKTVTQFTVDMQNMLKHGVTNPTIYAQDSISDVETILSIRKSIGMSNFRLYYPGLHIWDSIESINTMKTLSSTYGTQELYIYGYDEQDHNTPERRALIDAVHSTGTKVFCAQTYTQALGISDLLDIAVVSFFPDPNISAAYHNPTGKYDSISHKTFSYTNPQSVPEYPRTFRLNYGLLLWQNDYDGAMDFAYQFESTSNDTGNIWDDFDNIPRDHCFTYPTTNGTIDTIQWEGYREATNDIKYLTALQNAISDAKTRGVVTTDIDTWLTNLKTTDLSLSNLDTIRSKMIDYILQLQSSKHYRAILTADGTPIMFNNKQQPFVVG